MNGDSEQSKRKNGSHHRDNDMMFHEHTFWGTACLLGLLFLIWHLSFSTNLSAVFENLLRSISLQTIILIVLARPFVYGLTRLSSRLLYRFVTPHHYWRYVLGASILSVGFAVVIVLAIYVSVASLILFMIGAA